MKKLVIVVMILFSSGISLVYAQDQNSKKVSELGLTFSNLNQFGFDFKTGNEKMLLRMKVLFINLNTLHDYGQYHDSVDMRQNTMGAGFRLGFERRIPVAEKFHISLGSDLGINYNYQNQEYEGSSYTSKSWTITPGVSFVFGAGYQISKHFILSAELAPTLNYMFGKQTLTYTSGNTDVLNTRLLNFGLSSSNAAITIAYRFLK
jgi:hypothetical protein